jgi:hypothetical protein
VLHFVPAAFYVRQGNNVDMVSSMVSVQNSPPSPSPVPRNQLIPDFNLFGTSAQNNSSSRGRAQGSVGVGPGQDVQAVAEQITSGRYEGSDLDK